MQSYRINIASTNSSPSKDREKVSYAENSVYTDFFHFICLRIVELALLKLLPLFSLNVHRQGRSIQGD